VYKILTLNNISVKGLDRLPRDCYEVASEISNPDAILVRSANMHNMEFTDSLKAVGRAGAGVNNIPVARLSEKGIPVFNAPGANANAVKELVVAGMLLACRNICQGWDYASDLQGDDKLVHRAVEAGKKQFVGYELPGRVLGVIGLGAIGVRVANAAKALGMRVIGYDPTITVERAWQLSSEVGQATSVDDLLSRADFISFHVPLVETTRNMINAERLRLMRDGVVILNFARGGIVDDAAVVEAIDCGKVYAYVCDFPNNIIKNHPRVISLPHLGASTREAEENCAVMVADQLKDFLEDGNISNSVNLPEVHLPRKGRSRMVVVNANVPDMVGKISHDLGKAKVNILHMVNESNGDLAYTMLDTETEVATEIVEKISVTEGVLKVRLL
jgi:D-3-phosphoglycerate dehydrogenase